MGSPVRAHVQGAAVRTRSADQRCRGTAGVWLETEVMKERKSEAHSIPDHTCGPDLASSQWSPSTPRSAQWGTDTGPRPLPCEQHLLTWPLLWIAPPTLPPRPSERRHTADLPSSQRHSPGLLPLLSTQTAHPRHTHIPTRYLLALRNLADASSPPALL